MVDVSTILTTAVSVVSVLGGWEAVKYFLNKDQNKRIKEAEADSAEFNVLRETNTFLQEQLNNNIKENAAKEQRFADQTARLREVQDREHKLMLEKAKIELELQKYKCVRSGCPNREPQNGF